MGRHSLNAEVVYPHTAGIDLGSVSHVACAGDGEEHVRTFSAMTHGLHEMAAWFHEHGITHVVMESTSVYWMPVYDVLEAAKFHVALVNAAHVHNVPGRKSDVADCQWLRKVYALGFLNDSFVPEEMIRTLRTLVRQRDRHITQQGEQTQLMQKALDQMNVKIHTVLSDFDGRSGLAIVRAILAGERDPEALLALTDTRVQKNKGQAMREALRGTWKAAPLFTLKQAVAGYDFYTAQITECNEEIRKALEPLQTSDTHLDGPRKPMQNHPYPFDAQEMLMRITGVDLCALTGLSPHNVLQILAETGTDMSKFKEGRHLVSWLSLCPPKRGSGKRTKLKRKQWHPGTRAGQSLRLAARVIGRTHTALGAFYRRLNARCGPKVANMATARKLALIIYEALRHQAQPTEMTEEQYERAFAAYRQKTLDRQARTLGLKLVPMNP